MQRVNETLSLSVAAIVVAALFSTQSWWVITIAFVFAFILWALQASLFDIGE